MLEKLELDGKVIVITGGGTGLGRAMGRSLARAGADLVIAGRRTGPIEEARDEFLSLGSKSIAVATDVTDSQQVDHKFLWKLITTGPPHIRTVINFHRNL